MAPSAARRSMTAAATSVSFHFFAGSAGRGRVSRSFPAVPPGVVAGELPGDAAAARAAHQAPLQGLAARGLDLVGRHAELGQPVRADFQVVILAEGVEGQPEAEALGERDLLLGGLAGMDVAVGVVLGSRFSDIFSGIRWRRFEVAYTSRLSGMPVIEPSRMLFIAL
jgi:hypothetical protein